MTQLLVDINSAAKNVGRDRAVYNKIDVRADNPTHTIISLINLRTNRTKLISFLHMHEKCSRYSVKILSASKIILSDSNCISMCTIYIYCTNS